MAAHRRRPRRRADAPKTQPGRGSPPRVGPLAARLSDVPALDVDALLADHVRRIIVCCGSGGVGKTTTAASLALRAAEQGRKVVVLTIDPATPAGPVDGAHRARQHPAPGVAASTPRPAAASTR